MSAASAAAEVAVICGPTAAGKSDIALRLAERHGRAILVADSRQVYRRFDIGTAKPSPAEQQRVRHLAIDLVDPTERYSASRWAGEASAWLASGGSTPPIVVGGTGLYLRALFDGLFTEPRQDPARRDRLRAWLDTLPTEELRRWVEHVDSSRAKLGRTQLLRALEVALLSGERISELHASRATISHWRPRYLVIDPGESLHARIDRRLDAMIEVGWLDEVRALRDLPDDAPAWKSSGYRMMRSAVSGVIDLEEARERVLIETRQYAKRQRTWFRHQLPENLTTRINPESPGADEAVERWWASLVTA